MIRLLGEELKASRVHYTHPDHARREALVSEEYLAAGVGSVAGRHRFSDSVFELYSRGEPVVIADYREHPAFAADRDRPAIADLPVRAILDIPLIRDGSLVAVLSIHQTERREWSQDEIALAIATAERSWSLVERVKAEEQLRRSEEQAQAAAKEIEAIYATAPIGLTVLDTELRYVRINEHLAEINGFTPAEHIGKSVHEIVPSLGGQADHALREVLAGEPIWGLEITGDTRADPGNVRTWRENWLPLKSPSGEVTGIAVSAE